MQVGRWVYVWIYDFLHTSRSVFFAMVYSEGTDASMLGVLRKKRCSGLSENIFGEIPNNFDIIPK